MKRKYIVPTSRIYNVTLHSMILSGSEIPDENWYGGGTDEEGDDGDYSREDNSNNGGNSVWDNAW